MSVPLCENCLTTSEPYPCSELLCSSSRTRETPLGDNQSGHVRRPLCKRLTTSIPEELCENKVLGFFSGSVIRSLWPGVCVSERASEQTDERRFRMAKNMWEWRRLSIQSRGYWREEVMRTDPGSPRRPLGETGKHSTGAEPQAPRRSGVTADREDCKMAVSEACFCLLLLLVVCCWIGRLTDKTPPQQTQNTHRLNH